MKEHIYKQLSDEWFAARSGKLTGSTFQKLMPTARQKIDAWNETQLTIIRKAAAEALTGQAEPSFTSQAMEWGIINEGIARKHVEVERMATIRECGFYEFSDHLGASPDGIIGKDNAVWECKCPMSKQHLRYFLDSDELFKDYKWQVYGEMMSTGIYSAVLCSFDPRFKPDKQLVQVEIEAETGDLEMMIERLNLAVDILKDIIS